MYRRWTELRRLGGCSKRLRDRYLGFLMEMLSEEMDMSDIRLARPNDAQAIHLILQDVWRESLLFDVFMDLASSPPGSK